MDRCYRRHLRKALDQAVLVGNLAALVDGMLLGTVMIDIVSYVCFLACLVFLCFGPSVGNRVVKISVGRYIRLDLVVTGIVLAGNLSKERLLVRGSNIILHRQAVLVSASTYNIAGHLDGCCG